MRLVFVTWLNVFHNARHVWMLLHMRELPVFDCKDEFCSTQIGIAAKYLKNKAELSIHVFESLCCDFTPLAAIYAWMRTVHLKGHFLPANSATWMFSSRNSLRRLYSLCARCLFFEISPALTCYPLRDNVLYTLSEYVDGRYTLKPITETLNENWGLVHQKKGRLRRTPFRWMEKMQTKNNMVGLFKHSYKFANIWGTYSKPLVTKLMF